MLGFCLPLWYNKIMSKTQSFTKDELNNLSKDALIMLLLQQTESMKLLTAQVENLNRQISSLQENLAVLTQNRFGRKTEKTDTIGTQLSFDPETMEIINEAEMLLESGIPEEPAFETVVKAHTRKKHQGKRDEDLSGFPVEIVEHRLSPDQLDAEFPGGYYEMKPEIYKELEVIPAQYIVYEHHVYSYISREKADGDSKIIRAPKPERLLNNSILTPSLASYVINQKYVDAMPLNRIHDEFKRNDLEISRQVLAGWMIKLADRYLYLIYNAMKKVLLSSKVIHCDETPFTLIHDGKGPKSKNYMWVYHSDTDYGTPPIYIYEYQPTRKTDNPRKFLQDFHGTLVTDGYQVYHTLQDERPDDIIVAGCWAHTKRKWAEIVKSVGAKTAAGTIAAEGNNRIAAIYHIDNMYKGKSKKDILDNRRSSVKPLVDSYFAWLKSLCETHTFDKAGKTYKAIQYSLNQEKYLRRFLDDPIIPLDNNDAERSIRAFCVGKHNWHVIDSKNGATSSAMLYSIAETAKANKLKPYEYFKHMLNEILIHQDEPVESYINNLLPWSDTLPDLCKSKK